MDGLTLRAEDLGLTPEMLDRVAQGESVEITRGGAVVAKVVATPGITEDLPKVGLAARFAALRAEANRLGLGLTQDQIREMRDDLRG